MNEEPGIEDMSEGPIQIEKDRKLIEGATLLEWIGSGDFGKVYRAREGSTGKTIAIKLAPIRIDHNPSESIEEATIHLKLKHENIVELLSYYVKNQTLIMHMEYFRGMDLLSFIYFQNFNGKPHIVKKKIREGIKSGIQYIHERNIVHGDVHFGNVIVNRDGHVKLIDFGCSHHDISKIPRDLQMADELYRRIDEIGK